MIFDFLIYWFIDQLINLLKTIFDTFNKTQLRRVLQIDWFIHSFTHSFTHSFFNSFTYSSTSVRHLTYIIFELLKELTHYFLILTFFKYWHFDQSFFCLFELRGLYATNNPNGQRKPCCRLNNIVLQWTAMLLVCTGLGPWTLLITV